MISTTRVPSQGGHSRRHFLAGASAVALAAAAPGRAGAATTAVSALIYPINQPIISGPYPEQTNPLYSASSGKWGVSFSGGGSRAFSAALGQMRGLTTANVIGNVGAISCISGGTWFGAPYTFAPETVSDSALLGPLVQPANITIGTLAQSAYPCLSSLMENLNNSNLHAIYKKYVKPYLDNHSINSDKVYSRILNQALLAPYGLASTTALFTLDKKTRDEIRARNRGLSASFLLPKLDRPFFIAGGTQIVEQGTSSCDVGLQQTDATKQTFRNIEYTPLYVGAPQFITAEPAAGISNDYGGGYVESFAFDTPAPSSPVSNNVANVPPGPYPFLLSDVVGSSSAAPEAILDLHFQKYSVSFPAFEYWSVHDALKKKKVTQNCYNFGDGGIFENTGVVSLLRRGYRTIFAFVNTSSELGKFSFTSVDGIAGEISRLFGKIPLDHQGNSQSTQVFSENQFDFLAGGLKDAYKKGGPAVFADTFPVIANNVFGIAPYTPKIFWFYNATNMQWFNALPSAIKDLIMDDPKNTYQLKDFPYYKTVLQNGDQVVYLTPTQVNLLADMWAYTVNTGFQTKGYAFGVPID